MPGKLTFDHVRNFIESYGYTLLVTEYINSDTKMDALCPIGHHIQIRWDDFKQGKRCGICANKIRYTYEFIKDAIEKCGWTLLTDHYINGYQKLECICDKGHHTTTCWTSFQQGRRCRKCADLAMHRFTPKPERRTPEYLRWCRHVFKRDKFKCTVCGSNKKLNAHHLFNFDTHKDLRYEESNGCTMCEICHRDFHRIYTRYNNTPEQYEEYKRMRQEVHTHGESSMELVGETT